MDIREMKYLALQSRHIDGLPERLARMVTINSGHVKEVRLS